MEAPLAGCPGSVVVRPTGTATCPGVVVLSGSSGRIEHERARLLASAGAAAAAVGYFGGPGQPPGICEVPLETIAAAVTALAELGCSPIGLLGASKGAEAALVLATLHAGVDAVVAIAPTSVVWANVGPGLDGADRPLRSSWTWHGEPLDFVPYDDEWSPAVDPPEFRGLYERSLVRFADAAARAAIPTERFAGRLVLIAGGDDRVWPSDDMARALAARRPGVELLIHPDAGHRLILPGEAAPGETVGGMAMARGGSDAADSEHGRRCWPLILDALQIG